MCSIVASFNPKKLMELYTLNSYRGVHSHSITAYNIRTKGVDQVMRGLGEINLIQYSKFLEKYPDRYYIVHSQAPTTENNTQKSIHPASHFVSHRYEEFSLLWHNGILKPKEIKRLQEICNSKETWDTKLLLEYFVEHKANLSEVDGAFACILYHHNDLFIFRNEIAPLFIDFDMNISSTKFETNPGDGGTSFTLKPNTVFKLDLINRSTNIQSVFKTKNNPYYLEI